MRNAIKFILAVATAIILMLVVRAYAFTIYKVSNSNLNPVLKKNDRVLVNKLDRARFFCQSDADVRNANAKKEQFFLYGKAKNKL